MPYQGADGTVKEFKFDYLVTYVGGEKMAYRVLYSNLAERFHLVARLNLVSKQISRSFATALRLRTERHVTRDVAHNARLLFNCGTATDIHPEVYKVAASLQGAIMVTDLLSATEQFGSTFRHIVTLVRGGHLKIASKGEFTRTSYVCRPNGGAE